MLEKKNTVGINRVYVSTMNFDPYRPTWPVWCLQFSMPAPKTEQKPEDTMSIAKKETTKRKNTEEDNDQVSCVDINSFNKRNGKS